MIKCICNDSEVVFNIYLLIKCQEREKNMNYSDLNMDQY